MKFQRGDLLRPKNTHTWVGDPADVRSPVLYGEDAWPAVLLDGAPALGESEVGIYLYQRLLLSKGVVIEVFPSFLELCDKIE